MARHQTTLRQKLLLVASMLAITIVSLPALNKMVEAAETGNVTVNGVVQTPPPTVAATITKPTNGQTFTQATISVEGTCTVDTVVELYKNGVFAGSTPCQANGTYQLNVDLLVGANSLIAKIKDNLGQYGPDSNTVNVLYDTASNPLPPAVSQLLLTIDGDYRGSFPGEVVTIRPGILGGTPPYALKIDWGDGTEQIIARQGAGSFDVTHIYKTAGTKIIKLKATDNAGQTAFIQTIVVVNGKPAAGGESGVGEAPVCKVSFWRQYGFGMGLSLILFIIGLVIGIVIGRRRDGGLANTVNLPPDSN